MKPAPAGGNAARVDREVVSADGVRIRYRTAGAGDPTLVFVHGWTCDRTFWDAQFDHFARQRRVVALDLGGHGASSADRTAWTIPAFAEDVGAVLKALDLRRVVLVGHSMGGPVILEVARRWPDRILALVPVDIFFDVERKLTPELKEQFLEPLRSDFSSGCRELVGNGMFLRSSRATVRNRVVKSMCAASPEMAVAAMEGIWAYDVPAALDQVTLPIRCINSNRRKTDVDAARRHAPHFQVVVMKGVGHFVMMERPKVFNRLLEAALIDLVPPPAKDSVVQRVSFPES